MTTVNIQFINAHGKIETRAIAASITAGLAVHPEVSGVKLKSGKRAWTVTHAKSGLAFSGLFFGRTRAYKLRRDLLSTGVDFTADAKAIQRAYPKFAHVLPRP